MESSTTTLEAILLAKDMRLKARMAVTPLDAIRAMASIANMKKRPYPFLSTVTQEETLFVGQIHNSPTFTTRYDPVGLARRFVRAQVDAISLFTDEIIYEGGSDDLVLVSSAVDVPIISQDYIVDEYQIMETLSAGVSTVVLYAAILEHATLRQLISVAHRNRLTAIVQVSNLSELEYALSLSPNVIGISSGSPSPNDEQIDLDNLNRLREKIPSYIHVMVMETLQSLDIASAVVTLRPDAILIGEPLLHDDSALENLRSLFARR
jgi:indole-3-glycerol phosphate synthase